MGAEHAPGTVWQAQALYCVDRLSFDAVARRTGIAASTLKRWSERLGWRAKREELAQAEADIRHNSVMARAKVIKKLLDNPRADLAFAVSALEGQALKAAEAARAAEERAALKAAQESPLLSINTVDDAIAALKQAVEHKLSTLLARPEIVDLKGIQEVQRCLALLADMQAARPVDAQAEPARGMSKDMREAILAAMSGA